MNVMISRAYDTLIQRTCKCAQ